MTCKVVWPNVQSSKNIFLCRELTCKVQRFQVQLICGIRRWSTLVSLNLSPKKNGLQCFCAPISIQLELKPCKGHLQTCRPWICASVNQTGHWRIIHIPLQSSTSSTFNFSFISNLTQT